MKNRIASEAASQQEDTYVADDQVEEMDVEGDGNLFDLFNT